MSTDTAELCEKLSWDSTFWGGDIARIRNDMLTPARYRQVEAWCLRENICCLYLLAGCHDTATTMSAEDAGFHLVDVRVTLDTSTDGMVESLPSLHPAMCTVRPTRPVDRAMLETIARSSYRDTRFYYDRRFPRAGCDALYVNWIRNSCDGYADEVLVAESVGEPVGYITLLHHQDTASGTIGLLGVAEGIQGKGIGTQLVLASLLWFRDRNCRTITVVTQGRNSAAQRLYQRCGFRTRRMELWYHKWYRSLPDWHE